MTITYPLTLPTVPAPSRFTINQASFSAFTQSPWSAAQQVQLQTGQLWSISADYPPMNDDQARNWAGILASLNGRYGTFLFGDPKWKTPRGAWGSAPLVNGASQTGQSLSIDGLATSATIRGGDYFQLGSGSSSRLYLVTQDATASAGAVTLDIWPRLRSSPADNDPITVTNPVGVFRLSSPNIAKVWEPFRWGFSIEMLEAL